MRNRIVSNLKNHWPLLTLMVYLFVTSESFADASRLEAAVRSTGSSLKSIAIAGLGIGTTVSAIAFAIGAAAIGRVLFASVICGGVVAFGGQSFIELLQRVFN